MKKIIIEQLLCKDNYKYRNKTRSTKKFGGYLYLLERTWLLDFFYHLLLIFFCFVLMFASCICLVEPSLNNSIDSYKYLTNIFYLEFYRFYQFLLCIYFLKMLLQKWCVVKIDIREIQIKSHNIFRMLSELSTYIVLIYKYLYKW